MQDRLARERIPACPEQLGTVAHFRQGKPGWREYMRKRSILLVTGALALVASLVDRTRRHGEAASGRRPER